MKVDKIRQDARLTMGYSSSKNRTAHDLVVHIIFLCVSEHNRKNWLFSNAAYASSILYSIVETAKANNFISFNYLHHVMVTSQ
jgi:hypothetical protein